MPANIELDPNEVIKQAADKARALMTAAGDLFQVQFAFFCPFCPYMGNHHTDDCKWNKAKAAYDDVVTHTAPFMS